MDTVMTSWAQGQGCPPSRLEFRDNVLVTPGPDSIVLSSPRARLKALLTNYDRLTHSDALPSSSPLPGLTRGVWLCSHGHDLNPPAPPTHLNASQHPGVRTDSPAGLSGLARDQDWSGSSGDLPRPTSPVCTWPCFEFPFFASCHLATTPPSPRPHTRLAFWTQDLCFYIPVPGCLRGLTEECGKGGNTSIFTFGK